MALAAGAAAQVALGRGQDIRGPPDAGRSGGGLAVRVDPLGGDRAAVPALLPAWSQRKNLGGTIQHLLYNGIVHNFPPGDAGGASEPRAVIGVEDALIDTGRLPSDFMLLIGRRKDAPGSTSAAVVFQSVTTCTRRCSGRTRGGVV